MLSIQERLGLKTEPIEGAAWQWACMLRSATPGIVVSFDPIKQTCVGQPVIQEVILAPAPGSSDSSQNIPTSVTIKPILDVPIVMTRVPGWSITLPITAGTECLLIFADSCIDGWWANGGISAQFDRRRHDLSDAMALFGPWSQPNVLSNYSTTSMQIRSDDQTVVIDLATGQITIEAPSIQIKTVGGTTSTLVNSSFITWITTVLLPALSAHGITVSAPPSTALTTVLKAQ